MSPSRRLVAEGRIVYAGALADQGRIDEALALLRKRAERHPGARRSTTCASGTPSPTSRSAPATSPVPASSSTGCASADPPVRPTCAERLRRPRVSCHTPVVGSHSTFLLRFPVTGSSDPQRGRRCRKETKPHGDEAQGDEASRRRRAAGAEPERGLRPVLRRPPEIRVLESGTRLATLAVRCPRGPTTAPRRCRSPSGTRPPGWSARPRRRGRGGRASCAGASTSDPAASVAGRRRGRVDRSRHAIGAGSTPRSRRPKPRSRRSR